MTLEPGDRGPAPTQTGDAAPPVPRIGRVLDTVGLVLFLVGAALFGRAWLGFQEVRAFVPGPEDPPWASIQLADGYWLMQRIGVGVMALGIAVFVAAWWVARPGGRHLPR